MMLTDGRRKPPLVASTMLEKVRAIKMKAIYVGLGNTAPGELNNGSCIWHHAKVYVHPLIEGISENLWKRIYNETSDYRPMYGKDGSKVYLDDDNWQIVRVINGKTIKIANVTEVG